MIASIDWARPEWVHGLWIAAAIAGALVIFELRRQRALERFMSRSMQRRLARGPSRARRLAAVGAAAACLGLGVLGLMRPQAAAVDAAASGRRTSADIMVVLDVSRSMLAEDAAPNRLARARAEIASMLDRLEGHRVGLIAFAGKAAVLAPLTGDYGFFRMMLRGAGPTSVSRGGTAIGEALRLAVEAFGDEAAQGARLILLITDGEDHDSQPREAAKAAAEADIAVVSVGLGSEEGSQILITDPESGAKRPVLDGAGNPVISRVDGELLRDIGLETGGVYVPAGTAALDLESIVSEHVVPLLRDAPAAATRAARRDLYMWPVLGALVMLVLAVMLSGAAGRQT